MSRTSGSWVQPVAGGRFVVRADAARPRRPARTRPGSGDPTTAAARCTSRACCRPSRTSAARSPWGGSGPGRRGRRPRPPCASGADVDEPLQGQRGSTTVSQREQWPDGVHGTAASRRRPGPARQRLADGDPGGEPVHPVEAGAGLRDDRLVRHDVEHREAVPPADLEVVRVVRRSHLDRTGAELGIDVLVGDDGDPPADERQLDLAADEVVVPRVRRGAPRRRCRRASSRRGWWPRRPGRHRPGRRRRARRARPRRRGARPRCPTGPCGSAGTS